MPNLNQRTEQQKPPDAAHVEQVLDPRYKDLICFNYGLPGHFAGNCIKRNKYFICNKHDHKTYCCSNWIGPHLCATYFSSAIVGLGFYHIEVPTKEGVQWLYFQSCGGLVVRKG